MVLGELAGWSALVAIPTLVASGIALALFFGGAGAFWGPVNDVLTALTLVALILPIVAVWRLAPDDMGPWFGALCALAIAGALLGAIGQLLLVAGVIDLATSFVTGGAGILPVVVWAVAVVALTLTRALLPVEVGWLLAASLVAAVLLTVSSLALPWIVTAIAGVILLGLLCGWLAALSAAVRVVT